MVWDGKDFIRAQGRGRSCACGDAVDFAGARQESRHDTNLLLINPNTSDSVSELIRAEAERSASAGTEIEVLTAPFGVAYIETRFEALIGAYAAAELAAEHHANFDAVIVAAFGDPGLDGLREVHCHAR